MKVENADSKTDVFVKISLFFFVSLLSFSIGIFVGKKFSDNQHKLALLEPSKKSDIHSGSQASTSSSHQSSEDPTTKSVATDEMTEEEIAKLAEEFVEDEAPLPVAKKIEISEKDTNHDEHKSDVTSSKTTAATSEKSSASLDHTGATHHETSNNESKTVGRSTASIPTTVKEKAMASATHNTTSTPNEVDPLKEAIKQVADNKLPEAVSKNEKVANKTGGSLPEKLNYDSLGKYTIQVGSYAKEEDAAKAAEDLKKKGYAAFYVTAKVKDQSWFRVSIGLFATQKEAVEYKKTLIDNKSVQSAIIQKIVN